MDQQILTTLAASLGIGLIVGIQREYDDHKMAGIRTFSLTTILGTLTAMLGQYFNSEWIIAIGLLCTTILIGIANFIGKNQEGSIGQTTEIALLLMFTVGAYLVIGDLKIGIIVGAITALLLHLKSTLGNFVDRLSSKDIKAIMQFVAISLIVLPVLPDNTYGPYNVLNPHEIWLMVVLIVGIGLAGYFLYKWFGDKTGTIFNGILGGMISSTATTVTFAKRTKDVSKGAQIAAFIIFIATVVSLVRVLIEVTVVTPQNLSVIAPPIILEIILMSIICILFYFYFQKQEVEKLPDPENPAQFKSALIFGFLYGAILLGVAAASDFFGDNGLYIISIISGLTDVDAITLSLSNTLNRGGIEAETAWKLILLASMSNLVFKGILAIILGTRDLAKYIFLLFGVSLVLGLLIIWLWVPIL